MFRQDLTASKMEEDEARAEALWVEGRGKGREERQIQLRLKIERANSSGTRCKATRDETTCDTTALCRKDALVCGQFCDKFLLGRRERARERALQETEHSQETENMRSRERARKRESSCRRPCIEH